MAVPEIRRDRGAATVPERKRWTERFLALMRLHVHAHEAPQHAEQPDLGRVGSSASVVWLSRAAIELAQIEAGRRDRTGDRGLEIPISEVGRRRLEPGRYRGGSGISGRFACAGVRITRLKISR